MSPKSPSDLTPQRSPHREKIEQNSGYQELQKNPNLRRSIARYLLIRAHPEIIGYHDIIDRINKDFNMGKDPKDQITFTTALRYLFQGRANTAQFAFENLVQDDPAYIRFATDKEFRGEFLASMQKHNVTAMDYTEDYIPKVGLVVADMYAQFHIETSLCAKYLLSDRKRFDEILASAK